MEKKAGKVSLLGVYLIILLLVLSLTGFLNISALRSVAVESYLTTYSVGAESTIKKIEHSLRYGKSLDLFYGIEDYLQEIKNKLPEISDVLVVVPSGQVKYSLSGDEAGTAVASELQSQKTDSFKGLEKSIQPVGSAYYVILPIKDQISEEDTPKNPLVGNLVIKIERNILEQGLLEDTYKLIYCLLGISLFSIFVVAVIILKTDLVNAQGVFRRKTLLTVFIVSLSMAQLAFGLINYSLLKSAYWEITDKNVKIIGDSIAKDLEAVLKKDVPYRQISGLEAYIEKNISKVDYISSVNIRGTLEVSVVKEATWDKAIQLDLPKDIMGHSAALTVSVSTAPINAFLKEKLLDLATILITSLIFLYEITLFAVMLFEQRWHGKSFSKVMVQPRKEVDPVVFRTLSFILFFGVFLAISFIPILMKDLYKPMLGLSREMVLGLPISAEMFFAAIATIFAGYFVNNKGYKWWLLTGMGVIALGSVLSGLASSAVSFIIGRSLAGIGYGVIIIAIRAGINSLPSEELRSAGFAGLVSGLYAGLINGVVIGAMLAERIGYSAVFFAMTLLIFTAIVFTLLFIPRPKVSKDSPVQNSSPKTSKRELAQIFGLVTNLKVLIFLSLVIIPVTISGMFLDFYFPLFAQEHGISASNIGRAFMLNSLCIVFLGPVLSKLVDKRLGNAWGVAVSGLLVGLGLVLFAFTGNLLMAFLVVIVLGLADAFGLVVQNNYFIQLKAVSQFGIEKSIGYYDNARKLGQLLGPMVFGGIAFLGVRGIGVIGMLVIGGTFFFILSARKGEAGL